MNKLILLLLFPLLLSCDTKESLQKEISSLKEEKQTLLPSVERLRVEVNLLTTQRNQLSQEVSNLNHLKNGGTLEYLIEITIRKSFEIESTKLTLSVSKEFYNSLKENQDLDPVPRWRATLTKKEIKQK